MLKSSAEKQNNIVKSKTLITSFIPRQLSINFKSIIMNPRKSPFSLSSQQRLLLLHSISQFLHQNGFSKTLKKFRKEARFEKDVEGSCSLDIEEMCYEYLKSRDVTSETKSEKIKENGDNEGKKSEPTTENGTVDGANVKSKSKKKSKSTKDASEQVIEETQSKPAEIPEEIPLSLPSEAAKKSKDKKKSRKDKSEHTDVDIQEKQPEVTANNVEKKEKKEKKIKKEKNGSKKVEENVTDLNGPSSETVDAGDEKKKSKKRKKPSSEENGVGHVEEATLDNSKRRKTDTLDQSNGTVQPPKTPNGFADGAVEKEGKEKSEKQDKAKDLNGSAEPKTAKAFQRVKPEEVEFADERLQDNSYWAKDGADSGYGAKAQEVLGQVRGRDFRHEKTKKKRGSYRGGQIDLHTHSVKFNYEDEDE
ncbi:hypothetical protein RND81_08G020400 [Saponaria officinalis]|uniref:Srp40 C-terminal domain-containing protein n=1 Tax=Saponaria officinalis TaxID=3572 RepID=A0AAW1J2F8_SAPOF